MVTVTYRVHSFFLQQGFPQICILGWLSVCFYADMVNDPDELGDFVPSGLMGKDACCLNLEEDDPAMRDYILARLGEAAASAAK